MKKFAKKLVKMFILCPVATVLLLCLSTTDSRAILPVGLYMGPRIGMDISGKVTSTAGKNAIDVDSIIPIDTEIERYTETDKNIIFGEKSFYVGAVAGIRLFKFRFDIECGLRNAIAKTRINLNEAKVETINGYNVFANLYYNFLDIPFIKMYINGGIGNVLFAKAFIDNNVSQERINSDFAWLVGLGLNFSLFNVINLDVGYRYVDMGKLKLDGDAYKIKSNDVFVGLRFGF